MSSGFLRRWLWLGLAWAGGLVLGAGATTIGFEGLGLGAPVPGDYADLNWDGFSVLQAAPAFRQTAEGEGLSGEVARNMYILANVGQGYFGFPLIARIRSDENEVFDFISGRLSASWADDAPLTVEGYLDGVRVDRVSIHPARSCFGLFTFDFFGIDEVRFLVEEGNAPLYSQRRSGPRLATLLRQQRTFAMDEMRINRPTPVPDAGGTVQLLSLSLAALAAIGWVRCRGDSVPH